ncbi:hypothetical protein NQ318_006202 [Aromia moschata]|uniref:DUF4817 domain-containing protein n=1 Tax=Aromia moschata TaxID=1265417 RepID=A0AAV8YH09_9CUCU|nr:hypothetical protein NQ318_006202 [Aromia moschata]
MNTLSEEERIYLLMMRGWGDQQRSYNQVRDLFNQTFRVDRVPISKTTVQRTIQLFQETGGVKPGPIPGRHTVSTEERKMEVALAFVENPRSTIRKVEQMVGMDKKLVHKVLKEMDFHPYKVHLVQELMDGDPSQNRVL